MTMLSGILWTLLLTVTEVACLGSNLAITLDYGTYVGSKDITSGFNVWKGSVNPTALSYWR